MTRSLVVAPQWIGDAVMSEPLLGRLAARDEKLTVAALPWVAPVYRAMPQVASVLEWPFAHGRLDLLGRLQTAVGLRGRFDAAYVLPNSLKSALIPWWARIPRRVGYHGEGRFRLLTERLPNPPRRPPMVEFYGSLAGAGGDLDALPRLEMDAAVQQATLARLGLAPRTYWVFVPGAEYGSAKRWPAAHYAALATGLFETHAQPIVLLGSARELRLCAQIAALAPGTCKVLAGKTSLVDAMAVIAGTRGMVSNDSGLMHVGAAFGIAQVAVFGSTSPAHTPPRNERARVLWLKDELQLDCMPCFARTCRFGHTRCLTGVVPERVAQALVDTGACLEPGRQ